MEDIKEIIAYNLIELRKKNNLTQGELASKLNYSDKSISKWERGEGIPDVETLLQIANLFNVNLDYLVQKEHPIIHNQDDNSSPIGRKYLIITLLSLSVLWLVILLAYALLNILAKANIWEILVGGFPVSMILTMIFNCIWGKKNILYILLTMIIWSTLATIYIIFRENNPWQCFLIGIPLQIADILWFFLDTSNKNAN